MRIGNFCAFGLCVFMIGTAYAETTLLDRKTVSSKAYVNGTIGERGIYSDPTNYTAGTDGNKLVTASALKGSVTNLPTMETSKLTCANPDTCSLWTIEDQQVYGGNNNNNSNSSNNNNNNNG